MPPLPDPDFQPTDEERRGKAAVQAEVAVAIGRLL